MYHAYKWCHFNIYEHDELNALLSTKKFNNLGPGMVLKFYNALHL